VDAEREQGLEDRSSVPRSPLPRSAFNRFDNHLGRSVQPLQPIRPTNTRPSSTGSTTGLTVPKRRDEPRELLVVMHGSGSHSFNEGQSPIAWLTVMPGFTPAAPGERRDCQSGGCRRVKAGQRGSDTSSGRRASSERSANSGIQQHAAVSLVRRGVPGHVPGQTMGTRIYPEDRTVGKIAPARYKLLILIYLTWNIGFCARAISKVCLTTSGRCHRPPAELVALGERVPPNIRFGTSTWTYDGWMGRSTIGPIAGAQPARRLEEYVRYPLFSAR